MADGDVALLADPASKRVVLRVVIEADHAVVSLVVHWCLTALTGCTLRRSVFTDRLLGVLPPIKLEGSIALTLTSTPITGLTLSHVTGIATAPGVVLIELA